jgi:hypothetical protein
VTWSARLSSTVIASTRKDAVNGKRAGELQELPAGGEVDVPAVDRVAESREPVGPREEGGAAVAAPVRA